MSTGENSSKLWRLAGFALAAIVGLSVMFVCVSILPNLILSNEMERAQLVAMSAPERATALNGIRGTLLQGIAGLAVFVGASIAWQQLRHNIRDSQVQRQLGRESQITERFSKAIDHLKDADTAIRLAGILTLDRVAIEAKRDRLTISNILAAYVRQRSPWPPGAGSIHPSDLSIEEVPPLRVRLVDVQAALTVLCRQGPRPGDADSWPTIDMSNTDLRMANLEHGFLWRARLHGSNLANANLRHANVRGVDFSEAILSGADFHEAIADGTTWWPNGTKPDGVRIVEEDGGRPTVPD